MRVSTNRANRLWAEKVGLAESVRILKAFAKGGGPVIRTKDNAARQKAYRGR